MKYFLYPICLLFIAACSEKDDPISISTQTETGFEETTEQSHMEDNEEPSQTEDIDTLIEYTETSSALTCFDSKLRIISTAKNCDFESSFLTCEVLTAEKENTIAEESFRWIPSACKNINETLTFTNGTSSTKLRVVEKDHFMLEERLNLPCNEDYEFVTYVCQKNEVFYLRFLNEKFGEDTVHIELQSIINSYRNQTPGPKVDMISIRQLKSNTNIGNFVNRYQIGTTDFDNTSKTFHNKIILNGNTFEDVVEFKTAKTIRATPHTRIYLKKDLGLFAFELKNELWLLKM